MDAAIQTDPDQEVQLLQQQLQQLQLRENLQKLIMQTDQHQLARKRYQEQTRYVIGSPPLDTDLFVFVGISVGPAYPQEVGAYAITFWDEALQTQTFSYVSSAGAELYALFLAIKSALDICQPYQSLTVITQSNQFNRFLNEGKIKGSKTGVSLQLVDETRALIESRPARVQGLELNEAWAKTLLVYASQLARTARKLRVAEQTMPPLPVHIYNPNSSAAAVTFVRAPSESSNSKRTRENDVEPGSNKRMKEEDVSTDEEDVIYYWES